MNRVQIASNVQEFLLNTPYYLPADINDSIQDGIDEICATSSCIYKSTTLPFQANLSYYDFYTLIPDYLGVYAIFNHAIKRWLLPTSIRKLADTRIDWDTICGTPDYFAPINFRYVCIFRKPSSPNYGNMEIFYLAQAPTLTDTLEIPIPNDHYNDLELYVEMDMLEKNQDFSQATPMLKDYQTNLDELTRLINSRHAGRIPTLR